MQVPFKTTLCAALTCTALAFPAHAASVELTSGPVRGAFVQKAGDSRSTLVEVLDKIQVTELGAGINPSSIGATFDLTWSIYATNESGTDANQIYSTAQSFTSAGAAIYDTVIDVILDPGYYYLQMLPSEAVQHRTYFESAANLPFTTSDSLFTVWGGFSVNVRTGEPFGPNSFLPAFSVTAGLAPDTVNPSPVPLPAGLPMMLAALGFVGLTRRRKKA